MPLSQLDIDEGISEAEARVRQWLAEYETLAQAPVREAAEMQMILSDPAALMQLKQADPERYAQMARRVRDLRKPGG